MPCISNRHTCSARELLLTAEFGFMHQWEMSDNKTCVVALKCIAFTAAITVQQRAPSAGHFAPTQSCCQWCIAHLSCINLSCRAVCCRRVGIPESSHHKEQRLLVFLPCLQNYLVFMQSFPACKITLLAFGPLGFPDLLCRAVLSEFFSQSVSVPRIALTQVQLLALRLIKPH